MKCMTMMVVTALVAGLLHAADDPFLAELTQLKDTRDKAIASEIGRIDKTYAQQLQTLLERAVQAGHLDAAVAIRDAIPQAMSSASSLADAPRRQAPDRDLRAGCFFITVDDSAEVYVNGSRLFGAGFGPAVKSPEIALVQGDLVVVQLHDQQSSGRGRHFKMAFAYNDGRVLYFRRSHFRDFGNIDPALLGERNAGNLPSKAAKPAEAVALSLPPGVRDKSDSVWGANQDCVLACTVSAEMLAK